MLKIIKLSIILLLVFNIFSVGILTAQAAGSLLGGTDYSAGCVETGNCQLNDFTRVVINISKIILGLVGSLSLLAFVAGGLMMMLSGGKAEMVTRGKQTIIGAVIGLAIVFTSYLIIQAVFASLGIENALGGKWSTPTWFKQK